MRTNRIVHIPFVLALCLLAFVPRAQPALSAGIGSWADTGMPLEPVCCFTQTLLPTGKVLKAGGLNNSDEINGAASGTRDAELYDPVTGIWSYTGRMAVARFAHTATLLPNGKVLVAGGSVSTNPISSSVTATAELYDPASGTWSSTGSMASAREVHTATLLPNGKVLVAGGDNDVSLISTAELYDPASGAWSSAGTLPVSGTSSTATLLPNGKVLLAGGTVPIQEGASIHAELYDPASNTWSSTGSMHNARANHTDTLLPDGKVLVAGGSVSDLEAYSLQLVGVATSELYDPSTGSWSSTGSMAGGRAGHTATLLTNGDVLVTGGSDSSGSNYPTSAELYDPQTGTWSSAAAAHYAGSLGAVTLLPDGTVLVDGGQVTAGGAVNTQAEIFATAAQPPPTPLFLKLRLAHTTLNVGQKQKVTVGTVPTTTAVLITVKFPNGSKLTHDATSSSSGSVSWSFKQPGGKTTTKLRTATVTVTVEHGAQTPIKKSKKYSIT